MASAYFPDDVYELILDYLPRRVIIELVEISPTIDRTVFSSSRLKAKIYRGWNNFSCKPEISWIDSAQKTKSQLLKQAKTLEEISFNLGFMEFKTFYDILRKYRGSLKKLHINGLALKNTSNMKKLNMKCLEEVHMDHISKDDVKYVLSVMLASKLRVLHYKDISATNWCENIQEVAKATIGFIAPLLQLKSLRLPWHCTEALINYSVFHPPFVFRLSSLEIVKGWNLGSDEMKFEGNFKRFLTTQSSSLKNLKLETFSLREETLSLVLQMEQLKTFSSVFCSIDFENLLNIKNSSIENLYVACSDGDLQTEISVRKILINCLKVKKIKFSGKTMTTETLKIIGSKNFLDVKVIDRLKTAQLLKLLDLSGPFAIKKETTKRPQNFGTLLSLLRFRVTSLGTSDHAFLIEKQVNSSKSFFNAEKFGDQVMVCSVKSSSYFSTEMISEGLFYTNVSAFKIIFSGKVEDKSIIIVHMRKDSMAVIRFIKTHLRVYGRHSLTWDKMRKFYKPAKRCYNCLWWKILNFECPFPDQCTMQNENSCIRNRKTYQKNNVWMTETSINEVNDLSLTEFPKLLAELSLKKSCQSLSYKKAELNNDWGAMIFYEGLTRVVTEVLRFVE